MSCRAICAVAVVWILSLVSVAVWAQSGDLKPVPTRLTGQPLGEVITGADIGFQRVAAEPSKDGAVTGKWMVKINGKWVETRSPVGVVR